MTNAILEICTFIAFHSRKGGFFCSITCPSRKFSLWDENTNLRWEVLDISQQIQQVYNSLPHRNEITWLGSNICTPFSAALLPSLCLHIVGKKSQPTNKKTGSLYSQVFVQYVSHSGSTLQKSCFHGLALPINWWAWSSPYLRKLLALSFKDQLRIIGYTFLHENLRVYPGSLWMTGWKSHYASWSMHTIHTHYAHQSLVASL